MTQEWLSALAELRDKSIPCVLLTIMEAKGSTPREAGTKMVVTTDQQFGTIGGGNLEFQAVGEARKLLMAAAGAAQVKDYPLGPALAQCCGGAVTVFLEPFIPSGKMLLLFGAGHVGREVVKVLEGLPVKVRWVDERPEEFPSALPKNCEKVVTARPLSQLEHSSESTYILVMTHSHNLDFEIVKAALEQGRFAYLGLIGSDTKAARFRKRLAALGLDIKGLTCPIGIEGVNGKHPREIAISVAAELLTLGLTHNTVREEDHVHQDHGAAG
ncbi:MAG: xanthine dehydrogenase accessory protein XdhC [Proteobacteria bacterium]|nr:xanthine dehydrogenase accessory protein XdhC [Pseudomonadota bacterium]